MDIKGGRAADVQPIEMGKKMSQVGCAATRGKLVYTCIYVFPLLRIAYISVVSRESVNEGSETGTPDWDSRFMNDSEEKLQLHERS